MIADNGVAIINDFGISRIIDVKGFSTKIMLNVRHNAPELMPLQDVPDQAIAPTTQSDIFSLGILLLQVRFVFCGSFSKNTDALPSASCGMGMIRIPRGDFPTIIS